MNRAMRRASTREKPRHRKHGQAKIPKIVIQDRDFHQIDLLMLKLANGEIEEADGRIVMRNMQGELYCVLTALEGWMDYWRGIAIKSGIAYDDGPLVRLKNRLSSGMMLTQEIILQASAVVDAQRKMYQATSLASLSSEATTTMIRNALQ